jgi:parvulin-like peptidyl-prolyl isomerase
MKFGKILSAATAAALAVSLCGCSIKLGTNTKISDDLVVAKAAGEIAGGDDSLNITYGDFRKEYLYYLKGQGITDDSDESVADTCKEQRSTIINYLINEKIIFQKADELGVGTLTDEEMDEVESEYNDLIDEQIEYFASIADFGTLETGEVISDSDKEQRGSDDFDKYLEDCGLTRDDLLMWQVSSAVTQKVIDEVTKDVTVEYSEAQAKFDDYVESIKALYADDVSEYETGGYYSAFWIPDGSRRIKHILLAFDDDFADELSELRDSDDEAADEARAEKAEEMQEQAQEIINMLDNGADFDELITEYSADSSGSTYYPDGYLVVPNSVSFVSEFTEAAYSLENVGDYCEAVSDYGVHIILYASDAVVTDEEIDSYVEYIYEQLDSSAKNSYFSEKLNEWKEEYAYEIDYDTLKIDEPSDETAETSAAATAEAE